MRLFFEAGEHKYTDELGNEYISVTTLLEHYIPKFDREYWLKRKSEELNIPQHEIASMWKDINDESKERGNATHNRLEDGIKEHSKFKDAIRYLKKRESGQIFTLEDIDNVDANIQQLDINKFREATDNRYPQIYDNFNLLLEQGYKIYSEVGGYIASAFISGCIDVPCVANHGFAVVDWKTNKDGVKWISGYYRKNKNVTPAQLTTEFVPKDERMLPPLSHLPNCKGYHYAMQLSIYAYMMETKLRLKCNGIRLCHIGSPFVMNEFGMPYRDERGMYTIDENGKEIVTWHKVPYLRDEVLSVIEDRKVKMNSTVKRQFAMF